MIYFQILMKILVDFNKLYKYWFKNLQFEFLFSFWSTLKTPIFERLTHNFINISASRSRIFDPRQDLEWPLNFQIMTKCGQYTFPKTWIKSSICVRNRIANH